MYIYTFVLIICMRAEAELSHCSPRFPQTLVSVTANGESRLLLTSQLITRRFHRRNVARVKVRTSGLFERKIRTRIIIALCLDGFSIINCACSMNKKTSFCWTFFFTSKIHKFYSEKLIIQKSYRSSNVNSDRSFYYLLIIIKSRLSLLFITCLTSFYVIFIEKYEYRYL